MLLALVVIPFPMLHRLWQAGRQRWSLSHRFHRSSGGSGSSQGPLMKSSAREAGKTLLPKGERDDNDAGLVARTSEAG